MDHRSANSLTFTQAATIASLGSITFLNTGANGFQSGPGRCVLETQHKHAMRAWARAMLTPLHARAYSRARSCSHARSLRYFDIVADADLNVLNANIQLNAGKVSAAGDSNYFDPAWLRTAPCSHSAACVPARAGSRRAALPLSHLQFSFRLKRFCSNGTVPYTSAFNGISFPGSTVGNVTYFSLSPSYVARPGRAFG